MAAVLASRPVLTPLSPKRRTVLGNVTNIVRGLDARKGLPATSKRPFCHIYEDPVHPNLKRVKPDSSDKSSKSNDPPSCSPAVPRFALVTKPAESKKLLPVPSGVVSSKKNSLSSSPAKRRHNLPSPNNAPRKVPLASTPPPKGIKRKIQKSVRRIDPPTSAASPDSIDARLIATPVSKATATNTTANPASWRPGQPFPNSWVFAIHEDTLEETLTNLMYHSTGTLDISDEEDLKSKCADVDRIGKENIPPPPSEAALAMPPPPAPRAPSEDMLAERVRSPLGSVDVEIFYPALKEERIAAEKARQLKRQHLNRAGLVASKFAAIDQIVDGYLKQQKQRDLEEAAAVPLPEDDEENEENENKPARTDVAAQTRPLAEDELFGDDL